MFESLRDAEGAVPPQDGFSPTASVVAATLEAVFGAEVAASLRPHQQPLATVEPRVAMKAVIGGIDCTLYADPRAINVLTPKTNADSHLRASALLGDTVVDSPSPRAGGNPSFAGVRYAMTGGQLAVDDAERLHAVVRDEVNTLGSLLVRAGIDAAEAIVVRHTFHDEHDDGTHGINQSSSDDEVLEYTAQQSTDSRSFPPSPPRYWIVFIAEGDGARFWSVVVNHGEARNDGRHLRWFRLERSDLMAEFRDRLTIDWPPQRRFWVHAATGGRFPVREGSLPHATSDDQTAEVAPVDPTLEASYAADILAGSYEVEDREGTTAVRGSAQAAFAKRVKDNYGWECAVTGIRTREFLVASHIVPWSEDKSIRLDPTNGICLSTFVDRAFDAGFLTITPEGRTAVRWDWVGDDLMLKAELARVDDIELAKPSSAPPDPAKLRRRIELGY